MSEFDRRDFLKKSAGLAAGALLAAKYDKVLAKSKNLPYDLVAIRGGEPEEMYDKGISVLGGIKEFVKKGQSVVVKPNIGWDVPPERAGNTNPKLVKRIIDSCFEAGASEVYVFDHTCDDWRKTYETTEIKGAAQNAGAKVVSGGSEKYYKKIKVRRGKVLKEDKIHELILDTDVFINVPILKHHGSARLTICMKNLMGINWNRKYWHKTDLHQCIADLATEVKPDLNIVDAYRVLKRNGPRGVSTDDVVKMKAQVISTDMVAADAASAKFFGSEPEDIPHIKIAGEMGAGEIDLTKLRIKRIKV